MNQRQPFIGRRWSRGFCILMAFFIAFGLMSVSPLSQTATADAANSNVTLAAWNCTTAGAGAVTAFPATTGANKTGSELTLQSSTGPTSFTKAVAGVAGVPTSAEGSGSNWAPWSTKTPNDPDMCWRIKLADASGYENIRLDFNAYGTATSPLDWEVKYSTDGTNFNSFSPAVTYQAKIGAGSTQPENNATPVTVDLSVFDDFPGPVYVGIFATSATTGSNPNNRLCNVIIRGDEIETNVDPDQAAADAVVALIEALPAAGDLTLDDEDEVFAARAAFDNLTRDQKNLVPPAAMDRLAEAEAVMFNLIEAAENQAAADEVTALIEALPAAGDLTLDNKADVLAARDAYDALTPDQQELVAPTAIEKLEAAEAKVAELEADKAAAEAVEALIAALPEADDITLDDAAAVAAAKDAYETLTDGQKALVSEELAGKLEAAEAKVAELEASAADQAAADAATALINALPEAGAITAADKEAVAAADKALNDLTEAQKALVGQEAKDKLQAAKDKIAAIEKDQADQAAADKVKAQIDAIGNVTLDSEAAIKAAEDAYNALTADQKAKVPAAATAALTAAKSKLTQLKSNAVQSVVVNPVAGDVVSGTGGIPGGKIKITLSNGTTATTTVGNDGKWSVTVPGASIATSATIAVLGKDGVQVGSYSVSLKKKVTGVKTLAKIYLVKGKSVILPGAVQPYFATDKKVTWKSSKPKIVSVSKAGKIKGLKPGKSVVTVTTNDGKKTAKCTVYVIKKATKANTLKKLTLTQKKAKFNLLKGKTYQVKYKLTPAKSTNKTGIVPKFTSSKKSVAVIDKAGVITALAPGTTKITVKAGKYKKTFTLIVK